jgi:hypothetical protein
MHIIVTFSNVKNRKAISSTRAGGAAVVALLIGIGAGLAVAPIMFPAQTVTVINTQTVANTVVQAVTGPGTTVTSTVTQTVTVTVTVTYAVLKDQIVNEYAGLFSDLLNKLAELSKSKYEEVAAKGFDVLMEIFLTAANMHDIVRQREVLCSSSAEMAFMRTANLTLNANLTTLYKEICNLYARMVPITVRPDADPQSLLEIIKVGAEIALKLVELDNIIAKDP